MILFYLTFVLIRDGSLAVCDLYWRTLPNPPKHRFWFSVCNLDEINQTEEGKKKMLRNALYFSELGHWTPYPLL